MQAHQWKHQLYMLSSSCHTEFLKEKETEISLLASSKSQSALFFTIRTGAGQMLLFCIHTIEFTISQGLLMMCSTVCVYPGEKEVEKAGCWCSSLVGVNILKICVFAEPSN